MSRISHPASICVQMSDTTREVKYMESLSYRTEEGNEGWTPVRGRRHRAERTVPLHLVRRRAPPDVKATLESSSDSESDSDSSSASLSIPDHATVNFSIVDGKPGH